MTAGGLVEQHTRLPTFATSFVGRAPELAELSALLDDHDHRLITIVGPGGMGKTRLAVELARSRSRQYADGEIFVPLDLVAGETAVPLAIADALGFQPGGASDPAEQLGEFLGERELLLVLDNFEHVMGAAPMLAALLHAAPRLCCIVTSREVLSLQEEWAYPLDGMAAPSAGEEAIEGYAAVQLFMERARQVRPEIEIAADPVNIARICRLVDGMPLGLELAASWARYMDCASIADEIERSIDFLATTLRNVPERHRGLQAVFDQSWVLLEDPERIALRRCAVFRGGFTREAAEVVAGAGLPVLASLVNKSLLRQGEHGRFGMHELLRQFAEQRLSEDPEELAATLSAHSAYFVGLLSERLADLEGQRQVEATAEIGRDFANVRVAWQRAVEDRRYDALPTGTQALHRYFQHRSAYLDAVAVCEPAVETLETALAGEAQPDPTLTQALAAMLVPYGWFLIRLGRLDEVEAPERRALELGDESAIVPSLGSDPRCALGVLAMTRGDFEEAARQGSLALERTEAASDLHGQQLALYVLSNAELARGNYDLALAHAERGLAITETTGDLWFRAYLLLTLGSIAHAQGQLDAARARFQACYEARRPFDDDEGMAIALTQLGDIALQQGRLADADRAYRESLTRYRDIGDRGGLATAQCGLGRVATARGEHDAARERFQHALEVGASMRFVRLIFETLCGVGELLIATGEHEAAAEVLGFVESHPQVMSSQKERAEQLLGSADLPQPRRRSSRGSGTRDLDTMIEAVRQALAQGSRGGGGSPSVESEAAADELTPRELEVLQLMAGGRTNPEIARRLGISVGTAKWYSSQILGKLSVKNRTQAVARARERGIIP